MKRFLAIVALSALAPAASAAFTTAPVQANGVYKFTFGVAETSDGTFPVPASAVCDVNGTYTETFSYGFLGTTDDSYKNDVPSNLPSVPHAIDGFKVVKGQKIVLHDATDANALPCVTGPAASEYLPAGASLFEGRYPVRFAMRADERGYYAVTCTVANASSSANADVTLFSERCHTHAQHLVLAPGETKTFAWSVELAPNYFKGSSGGTYKDNAINVVIVGENAALASLTVVKQPTTTENATIRGVAKESINVGRTMWLCDDSTGTDQRCETPYFNLQNYAGVGSGLSRWAPANLSIRNQGEGGLSTSDNMHRTTCLLKPGDYLYVEYGHNEGNVTSFTNNLETYLNDANTAGANLIIVSPIERRYSWDADNNRWSRTLQGITEAGQAWVEEKIAAGARNVAFIDLNGKYSTWMNQEIVRINGINSNVSLKNAIDYYYQSGKGGKVDSAHPNNAGADWGAYWVWQDAIERVAAGEAEGATESQQIQAAVLKGITEGVQLKVGLNGTTDNTPWLVSDEIISAGKAPNSFWDATVRAGYDYANDVAVAAVDATCADGVVTLNGVTVRVLNDCNYTKAVVEIVSDSDVTNRYWSYCNYDASGNTSGDLVVPEVAGFIDADLDKDDATIASHVSETLTIPAGAKAYIWFAEASGNTWQVGENGPCSAVYPLEAWTATVLDDDCTVASAWEKTTQAVYTFETSGEEDGISFTSTGANSSGQKKNCGFTRALGSSIASGRFRVSFKARFGNGELVFALSNTKGTTTWPMEGGEKILTLDGSANVFGEAGPLVTLSADETPVLQTAINAGEWMDVDMIIDIDALTVSASVGGSDYETFAIASASHTPYSYFGITLAGAKAHAGAIDDVRIVTLAPAPQPIDYDDLDAHNFVWNPAVAAGDWNNAANWLYEGIAPALTYPSDVSQDVVRFDSAAVVSFPAAAMASNVTFNAAVTMQGGDVNRYGLTARLVDGTGTVTLTNSGFANPLKSPMTNTVNIVMTAGTTNHFKTVGTSNDDPGIYVRGNISGEGCYQINLANVRMCNAYFSGNNNDFRGDVYTTGGTANRSVIYWSENAVGTNTFLHIGHSYGTYNSDSYRMGGSVKFGGVEGGWWDRYDGNVLTIGYLNRDSSINLSNGVSGRANSVAKVGTANLTLGTTRIKNLTVGEGSVTMPIGIAPQALSIAEGAKVIIPGDAAWTVGTVTNLFSYTTLAVATSATLPQQVEVTGLAEGLVAKIAVADNTVTATIEAAEVAPTTDDENATITKNGDGSYTVEVTAETVAITVPDGVTVREVVVSPDTATVTGVPANATVKVAVSWVDALEAQHSAAYAIVKVNSETGAVSLDVDAVVTVGEEEIALRPELGDAGDEVAPLDVGEDVSVCVKAIPGLTYRLVRGATPDGIDLESDPFAAEKATSARVSLTDSEPPAGAAFYRVTADVK